jgi:hypothetical protein
MGALLEHFAANGVEFESGAEGQLHARGRLTGELRTLIRANKPALLAELAAKQAAGEDAGLMERRTRALAILGEHPLRHLAIVTQPGDPAIVGVAIRCAVYGEIEVSAERYDVFALLELMSAHGNA